MLSHNKDSPNWFYPLPSRLKMMLQLLSTARTLGTHNFMKFIFSHFRTFPCCFRASFLCRSFFSMKKILLWNFHRDECAFLLTQFRFLHDGNISSLYVFDLFSFAFPMCSSLQMLLLKCNKYEILSIKSYFYVCLSAEYDSPSARRKGSTLCEIKLV